MSKNQKHKIISQSFEVNHTNQKQAIKFKRELIDIFYKKISVSMERIFDEFSSPYKTIHINKIEIDLGTVPEHKLKTTLIERFPIELKRKLKHLFTKHYLEKKDDTKQILARLKEETADFENILGALGDNSLLVYKDSVSKAAEIKKFLTSGSVSASATLKDLNINEVFEDLAKNEKELITEIISSNQHGATIQKRLISQLKDENKEEVFRLFVPNYVSEVKDNNTQIVNAIKEELPELGSYELKKFKEEIEQKTVKYLIDKKSKIFDKQDHIIKIVQNLGSKNIHLVKAITRSLSKPKQDKEIRTQANVIKELEDLVDKLSKAVEANRDSDIEQLDAEISKLDNTEIKLEKAFSKEPEKAPIPAHIQQLINKTKRLKKRMEEHKKMEVIFKKEELREKREHTINKLLDFKINEASKELEDSTEEEANIKSSETSKSIEEEIEKQPKTKDSLEIEVDEWKEVYTPADIISFAEGKDMDQLNLFYKQIENKKRKEFLSQRIKELKAVQENQLLLQKDVIGLLKEEEELKFKRIQEIVDLFAESHASLNEDKVVEKLISSEDIDEEEISLLLSFIPLKKVPPKFRAKKKKILEDLFIEKRSNIENDILLEIGGLDNDKLAELYREIQSKQKIEITENTIQKWQKIIDNYDFNEQEKKKDQELNPSKSIEKGKMLQQNIPSSTKENEQVEKNNDIQKSEKIDSEGVTKESAEKTFDKAKEDKLSTEGKLKLDEEQQNVKLKDQQLIDIAEITKDINENEKFDKAITYKEEGPEDQKPFDKELAQKEQLEKVKSDREKIELARIEKAKLDKIQSEKEAKEKKAKQEIIQREYKQIRSDFDIQFNELKKLEERLAAFDLLVKRDQIKLKRLEDEKIRLKSDQDAINREVQLNKNQELTETIGRHLKNLKQTTVRLRNQKKARINELESLKNELELKNLTNQTKQKPLPIISKEDQIEQSVEIAKTDETPIDNSEVQEHYNREKEKANLWNILQQFEKFELEQKAKVPLDLEALFKNIKLSDDLKQIRIKKIQSFITLSNAQITTSNYLEIFDQLYIAKIEHLEWIEENKGKFIEDSDFHLLRNYIVRLVDEFESQKPKSAPEDYEPNASVASPAENIEKQIEASQKDSTLDEVAQLPEDQKKIINKNVEATIKEREVELEKLRNQEESEKNDPQKLEIDDEEKEEQVEDIGIASKKKGKNEVLLIKKPKLDLGEDTSEKLSIDVPFPLRKETLQMVKSDRVEDVKSQRVMDIFQYIVINKKIPWWTEEDEVNMLEQNIAAEMSIIRNGLKQFFQHLFVVNNTPAKRNLILDNIFSSFSKGLIEQILVAIAPKAPRLLKTIRIWLKNLYIESTAVNETEKAIELKAIRLLFSQLSLYYFSPSIDIRYFLKDLRNELEIELKLSKQFIGKHFNQFIDKDKLLYEEEKKTSKKYWKSKLNKEKTQQLKEEIVKSLEVEESEKVLTFQDVLIYMFQFGSLPPLSKYKSKIAFEEAMRMFAKEKSDILLKILRNADRESIIVHGFFSSLSLDLFSMIIKLIYPQKGKELFELTDKIIKIRKTDIKMKFFINEEVYRIHLIDYVLRYSEASHNIHNYIKDLIRFMVREKGLGPRLSLAYFQKVFQRVVYDEDKMEEINAYLKIIENNIAKLPKRKRPTKKKETEIDPFDIPVPEAKTGTEYFVRNAGMVILWPFLSTYFGRLKMLGKDKKFVDEQAQNRAAHLIQFIIAKQTETPEFELVLNKVIVGLDPSTPLDLSIDVTEEEADMTESLLMSVVKQWKALKTTSIDGLRGAFLVREGKLTKKPDAWVLQVETKPYDLLLDKMPWGVSMVRLSWMDVIMKVEWR